MEIDYFAYGSNMNSDQMRDRCPDSAPVGVACLERWEFRINSRGVATILPSPQASVHGVLWKISEADERHLDDWEGVDGGLYRKARVAAKRPNGRVVDALAYLANDESPGAPRDGYLEGILEAAESWGLPRDYIEEVRECLTIEG